MNNRSSVLNETGKTQLPVQLNTKGLNCPIPILRVKKALMHLEAKDTIQVETTDPGSVADFNIFCRTKGHKILKETKRNGVFTFLIRKSA